MAVRLIKESYADFDKLFMQYDGEWRPDNHDVIWSAIAKSHGEDMADDVTAALENSYHEIVGESLKEDCRLSFNPTNDFDRKDMTTTLCDVLGKAGIEWQDAKKQAGKYFVTIVGDEDAVHKAKSAIENCGFFHSWTKECLTSLLNEATYPDHYVTSRDLENIRDTVEELMDWMSAEDVRAIRPDPNTYGIGTPFIGIGSKGYIDLSDIGKYVEGGNDDEDDWEEESLKESCSPQDRVALKAIWDKVDAIEEEALTQLTSIDEDTHAEIMEQIRGLKTTLEGKIKCPVEESTTLVEVRTCLDWMNELAEILEQDYDVTLTRQSTSRTKILLSKDGKKSLIFEVKDFKYCVRSEDGKVSKKFNDISDAQKYLENYFK